MTLIVPCIQREGTHAAHVGSHMSDFEHPQGFTFCPYADGSVERWNFLCGCVGAYMGQDIPLLGEQG